jgi:hypothetical protein
MTQDMEHDTNIFDPITQIRKKYYIRTIPGFSKNKSGYPYMDTLKWFYIEDGYLMNTEDNNKGGTIYKLENTSGTYDVIEGDEEEDHDGQVLIDGEWYDEDEVVYCELGDEYATLDDAEWCEIYEEYATRDYINNRMTYSEYENTYIKDSDAVFSDYLNDSLHENNAVEGYKDIKKKQTDWFPDSGDNYDYITYASDGVDYDEDDDCSERYSYNLVGNGFIKVFTKIDDNTSINTDDENNDGSYN